MKLRTLAAALGIAPLAAWPVRDRASAQQLPVFVEFRVQKAPTGALVGDTAASLGYELHITNVTAAPLTLRRVEVLDQCLRPSPVDGHVGRQNGQWAALRVESNVVGLVVNWVSARFNRKTGAGFMRSQQARRSGGRSKLRQN